MKIFILLCAVTIMYYFINGKVDANTYAGLFAYMLGVYATVVGCGERFIPYFIKIVYQLAIISLPLYILQLIAFNELYTINNIFGLGSRGNSNSLVFNLVQLHAQRNCGFMWEPGAYAAILTITIFINITISRKYRYSTKQNIILFLTLLSTVSTMGILSLLFHFLVISLKRKAYLLFFITLTFSPVILSLDFLFPKLAKESESVEIDLAKAQYASDETRVSVSRLSSFVIDYQSFAQRPLLGYGMDYKTTNQRIINATYNENVVRSSGLMNLLLRFGLVGLAVYIFLFYRSVRRFTDGITASLFASLVLFVLFSNPLENSTFIFSLFFLGHGVYRYSRSQPHPVHVSVSPIFADTDLRRM